MAAFYDVIYRGKDVTPLRYAHEGEQWALWTFVRGGEQAADAEISRLVAQGYEATRVYVGKPRSRDIDD